VTIGLVFVVGIFFGITLVILVAFIGSAIHRLAQGDLSMGIFGREPAAIAGAVLATLQALVLLGFLALDEAQLAGINVALIAVLTLFVRQSVTPNAKL
jgi:hypothetical protein